MEGKEVGAIDLDPEVFDAGEHVSLVHETVRWQRNRARRGTHCCLTKSEVSGGGKKPWRQKGTGRARCGSNTSPLWVGGGVIHGPKPRSYDFRLSKGERRNALAAVLSEKRREGRLLVLDELKIESGKTRDLLKALEKLGLGSNSVTIVTEEDSSVADRGSIWRLSGNMKNVSAIAVAGVNVYGLLRHQYVLGTKEAIARLQERVKRHRKAGA